MKSSGCLVSVQASNGGCFSNNESKQKGTHHMDNPTDTHDADQSIADALHRVARLVIEQAHAEQDDQRRSGILHSLASLLERPVRAGDLLVGDGAQAGDGGH